MQIFRAITFLLLLMAGTAFGQQSNPTVKQAPYSSSSSGVTVPAVSSLNQICTVTDNVSTFRIPCVLIQSVAGTSPITCSISGSAVTCGCPTCSTGGGYQPTPLPVPLAAASYTWVNQGSATITQNGAALTLACPFNASAQWRFQSHTNDFSTPYAISGALSTVIRMPSGSGFPAIGLGLTDGTKWIVAQVAANSSNIVFTIERWSSPTSFSSTVFTSTTFSVASAGGVNNMNAGTLNTPPAFMRWRNNGTTIFFDGSLNGYEWINMYSETVGTFLTPTGYGFGCRNDLSGATQTTTLLGWSPVNNATL